MPALKLRSRQIEVFRAVMRSGGASAAARLLGCSQPMVSQQIASLEKSLSLKLFDREHGRLVPTREAQAFQREVERHYIGMERLERKAESLAGSAEGGLFVGCQHALSGTVMPEVVRAYRVKHPDSLVSLQTSSSGLIKDMVACGEWHIGFVANEVDTVGVRSSVFCTVPAVAALPARHPLAGKAQLTLSDLAEVPFVALNPEDVARKSLLVECARQGIELRIAAECPSSAGVLALIRADVGIGLVNPLAIPAGELDECVVRPIRCGIQFRTLVIFPPSGGYPTQARFFLALARQALARRLGAMRMQ
ncbi:MAG: LysR substrate-binding domain-containing protein [Bradyrhizobium sp.]|uniref:LysR substrate-binding domain-containing protein n=1 Tax=Bradyrhizobium sp. TaxID=376 RepID=UPI003D0CD7FE